MRIEKTLEKDTQRVFFKPVSGRRYVKAINNSIAENIFYGITDEPPFLGIHLLFPMFPWFENIYRFPFYWNELMPETKAKEKGLIPLLTYEINVKEEGESDDKEKTQKMCLVGRFRHDQYYLFDMETHPFEMEITGTDGGQVKLIYSFVLEIEDMSKILIRFASGKFLNYAEKIIKSKLSNKFRTLQFDELRGKTDNGVVNETDDIANELNEKEFFDIGFKVRRIPLEDVIILPGSKNRIDEEQNIKVQEIKINTEKKKAEQLKIISTAEAEAVKVRGNAQTEVDSKRAANLGNIEADILGKKLAKVLSFQKDNKGIIDKTKGAVAFQHKNVTTLVQTSNSDGDDSLTNQIVADLVTKGGGNGK